MKRVDRNISFSSQYPITEGLALWLLFDNVILSDFYYWDYCQDGSRKKIYRYKTTPSLAIL